MIALTKSSYLQVGGQTCGGSARGVLRVRAQRVAAAGGGRKELSRAPRSQLAHEAGIALLIWQPCHCVAILVSCVAHVSAFRTRNAPSVPQQPPMGGAPFGPQTCLTAASLTMGQSSSQPEHDSEPPVLVSVARMHRTLVARVADPILLRAVRSPRPTRCWIADGARPSG